MNTKIIFYSLLCVMLFSCQKQNDIQLLNKADFEKTYDGKEISLYTLVSESGITAQVSNFGGRIVALWTPDKNGNYADIVLGRRTIDEYINYSGERFIGCVVGRYANRIANGQFELDGETYNLPINNNGQTLHGGLKGLDMVVWDVVNVTENEIQFAYTSPDGEEGFPGTLSIEMTYTLTPDNELKITYKAETDKPTVVNLSHHGFFNLKGEANGTINDHYLTINGSSIVPVNEVLIPTGELMEVENTPFDFRTSTLIGERIDFDHIQLEYGAGYDHNWVLDRKSEKDVEHAVSVYEPVSGRQMDVWTDQPGVQFYGGNFFDGLGKGKYRGTHAYREAFALETQHFPDSPNNPAFPSTRLNPGETYQYTCIYKFSVK